MRLLLLRHAKSDWDEPDLDDIDRPLNARGQAAALTMARYLVDNGLLPNLILCSTSQRTRETLARLLPSLTGETSIQVMPELYDQSEDDYLGLIRKHGGIAPNLMLIGHNPATELTADSLSGTGDADMIADFNEKYPTAALAVIDFDITEWAELDPKTGHLERFVKPRDLKDVTE